MVQGAHFSLACVIRRGSQRGTLNSKISGVKVCLDDIDSLLSCRVYRAHNVPAHVVREHARIDDAQITDPLHTQPTVNGVAHGARADGMVPSIEIIMRTGAQTPSRAGLSIALSS